MSETETVYKAVVVDEGNYYSFMRSVLPSEFCLQYRLGERTVAPGISRIFAFWTYDQAVKFIAINRWHHTSYEILKCEAEIDDSFRSIGRQKRSTWLTSARHLTSWWFHSGADQAISQTACAPAGTVYCKWLKPFKVVQ